MHCLREQLYGVWNFHVTTDKQIVNVFDTQELCTHNVPNKVQVMNSGHEFKFDKEDVYRVNLMDNYKAEAVFCKAGQKCSEQVVKGRWTSIYDQAFNIELDNGMRFVANFRYNIKPEVSTDPFTQARESGVAGFGQIESGDYDKFNSECGKTMVGFVQNMPAKTGKTFSLQQH